MSSLSRRLFQKNKALSSKQLHISFKMNLKEEFTFLYNLGLSVTLFSGEHSRELYACTREAKRVKTTHPEGQIRLSNILSSFYKQEKLTSIQVSIPESLIVRPRAFLSLVALLPQNKKFTRYFLVCLQLAKLITKRH